MANTYYDSELTAEEIEEVLEAINGILTPANNGKVLAISNGRFEARSVQWGGGSAVVEPLSITQNGTYNPPSGVDGYAPVTVNVSGGGGSPFITASFQGLSYGYVSQATGVPNGMWSGWSTKTNRVEIYEIEAGNYVYVPHAQSSATNARRRLALFYGKSYTDFDYSVNNAGSGTIYDDGVNLAVSENNNELCFLPTWFTATGSGTLCVLLGASSYDNTGILIKL